LILIATCGGRDYRDADNVAAWLEEIHLQIPFTHLVHGGANGADKLAGEWARRAGIQVVVCPANWVAHGKAAGPIRNAEMVAMKPVLLVAFPGGAGTENMWKQASKAGIKCMRAPQTTSGPTP